MHFELEYPYWIMVVGAVLVAFGFIGVAFRRRTNGTPVNDAEIEPKAEQTNPRTPKKVEWSSPRASDPGEKPKKAQEK